MQARTFAQMGAIAVGLGVGFPALAEGQKGHWEHYEVAKTAVIELWAKEANREAYSDPVYDLAQYQTFLLADGVSPKNDRLVGHLAGDERLTLETQYGLERFAFRVLRYEVAQSASEDLGPKSLFQGERYRVQTVSEKR